MKTSDVLDLAIYLMDLQPLGENEAIEMIKNGYMPNHFMVSEEESKFLSYQLPNTRKRYRSAYGVITIQYENVRLERETHPDLVDQWNVRFIERVISVDK